MITQDLSPGVQTTLYEMFPTSAYERDAHVKMMTERYLNYKMEYVKHLSFNPEEQNFSKFPKSKHLDKAPCPSISNFIWVLPSDTICQLNQLFSNSEVAMLSTRDPWN